MNPETIQNNPIVRHTFEFALLIDKYTESLYEIRRFDLARQLFRSGTSIGANVWEAQHPESKADFLHKIKIAQKEANETLFWLMICERADRYPSPKQLLEKLTEISKLLSAIVISSRKSLHP